MVLGGPRKSYEVLGSPRKSWAARKTGVRGTGGGGRGGGDRGPGGGDRGPGGGEKHVAEPRSSRQDSGALTRISGSPRIPRARRFFEFLEFL